MLYQLQAAVSTLAPCKHGDAMDLADEGTSQAAAVTFGTEDENGGHVLAAAAAAYDSNTDDASEHGTELLVVRRAQQALGLGRGGLHDGWQGQRTNRTATDGRQRGTPQYGLDQDNDMPLDLLGDGADLLGGGSDMLRAYKDSDTVLPHISALVRPDVHLPARAVERQGTEGEAVKAENSSHSSSDDRKVPELSGSLSEDETRRAEHEWSVVDAEADATAVTSSPSLTDCVPRTDDNIVEGHGGRSHRAFDQIVPNIDDGTGSHQEAPRPSKVRQGHRSGYGKSPTEANAVSTPRTAVEKRGAEAGNNEEHAAADDVWPRLMALAEGTLAVSDEVPGAPTGSCKLKVAKTLQVDVGVDELAEEGHESEEGIEVGEVEQQGNLLHSVSDARCSDAGTPVAGSHKRPRVIESPGALQQAEDQSPDGEGTTAEATRGTGLASGSLAAELRELEDMVAAERLASGKQRKAARKKPRSKMAAPKGEEQQAGQSAQVWMQEQAGEVGQPDGKHDGSRCEHLPLLHSLCGRFQGLYCLPTCQCLDE